MAPTARPRTHHTRRELQREIQKRRKDGNRSDSPPKAGQGGGGGSGGGQSQAWTPTSYTALKALLSARLCAAIWSLVADCDEAFNYWEPTHYLVYGRGLQTWEYAPQYALRSYTYLMLHAVPGKLYAALLETNRMLVFFFIRCLLALACAGCELYFYRGVCKEFGALVGGLTVGIMVFSAGMFSAATALLPSSFAMYMTMMAMGAWYQQCPQLAIFTTAISAILGWPFSAAIGAPIAYDILVRKRQISLFVKWCFISLATIMLPMVQIDSSYYGKLVVAPLNLIFYNIFSVGPNLYGTEEWTFYAFNGLLQFNVVFVAALLSLPLLGLVTYLRLAEGGGGAGAVGGWLALAPLYLWLGIFFPQPHKEERFLFPIFPLIPLAAALAFDWSQRVWRYLVCARLRYTQTHTHYLAIAFLVLTSTLSLSRIVGQYRAYHAPLEVYMELNRMAGEVAAGVVQGEATGGVGGGAFPPIGPDQEVNVCVGKEWYRYPSSFFLPGLNWNLRFLQSEFKGQLPQYFSEGPNGTSILPPNMNNLNKEEEDRYVPVSSCHFLVDLDDPEEETDRQPRYATQTDQWIMLHSEPFLNAKRSNRLLRAFYVPFLTERYCSYLNYTLLRRKAWRGGGGRGRGGGR